MYLPKFGLVTSTEKTFSTNCPSIWRPTTTSGRKIDLLWTRWWTMRTNAGRCGLICSRHSAKLEPNLPCYQHSCKFNLPQWTHSMFQMIEPIFPTAPTLASQLQSLQQQRIHPFLPHPIFPTPVCPTPILPSPVILDEEPTPLIQKRKRHCQVCKKDDCRGRGGRSLCPQVNGTS